MLATVLVALALIPSAQANTFTERSEIYAQRQQDAYVGKITNVVVAENRRFYAMVNRFANKHRGIVSATCSAWPLELSYGRLTVLDNAHPVSSLDAFLNLNNAEASGCTLNLGDGQACVVHADVDWPEVNMGRNGRSFLVNEAVCYDQNSNLHRYKF